MRSIFLAFPSYGHVEPAAALALVDATMTARAGAGSLNICAKSISLLAMNFNTLWCEALNGRESHGYTHFVMLHADIAPAAGWLWTLLEELDRLDADILSAVVPIKDDLRVTSTAVLDARERDCHRLSYADLEKLPASFDGRHWRGKKLLVNTGLMACRFDRPWVEKVHFTIHDSIEKGPDGIFRPYVMSEDWGLSIQAAELGCSVWATQKIPLKHLGGMAWDFAGKPDPVLEIPDEEDDDDDFDLAEIAELHASY